MSGKYRNRYVISSYYLAGWNLKNLALHGGKKQRCILELTLLIALVRYAVDALFCSRFAEMKPLVPKIYARRSKVSFTIERGSSYASQRLLLIPNAFHMTGTLLHGRA